MSIGADESIVANDRAVFIDAVVVADDGACADVDAAADGGIAEIAQVIGLGSLAEFCRLRFDEVADVHFVGKTGARTQPGVWTDPAVCTDERVIESDAVDVAGVIVGGPDRVTADAE